MGYHRPQKNWRSYTPRSRDLRLTRCHFFGGKPSSLGRFKARTAQFNFPRDHSPLIRVIIGCLALWDPYAPLFSRLVTNSPQPSTGSGLLGTSSSRPARSHLMKLFVALSWGRRGRLGASQVSQLEEQTPLGTARHGLAPASVQVRITRTEHQRGPSPARLSEGT